MWKHVPETAATPEKRVAERFDVATTGSCHNTDKSKHDWTRGICSSAMRWQCCIAAFWKHEDVIAATETKQAAIHDQIVNLKEYSRTVGCNWV